MLSERDLKLLDGNVDRREIMLKKLFEGEDGEESPEVKNMRIANEIMMAQDSATLKYAEIKAREDGDNKVSESVLAMLREIREPVIKPLERTLEVIPLESGDTILDLEITEYDGELKTEDFIREDDD